MGNIKSTIMTIRHMEQITGGDRIGVVLSATLRQQEKMALMCKHKKPKN